MFFSKTKRRELSLLHRVDSSSIGAVGKLMGSLWNAMDEEERKPYQTMSNQDRLRYRLSYQNNILWHCVFTEPGGFFSFLC
jgi:hypothetical protein